MKIALLTDGIAPYVVGGMQRHSYFIAKYLARNKVYVDLYHCSSDHAHDIRKLEVFTEEEKIFIRSIVIDFPEKDLIPRVLSPLFLRKRTEIPWRLPGHYLRRSYHYAERIFQILEKNLDGVDFIYVKGFAGWKLLEAKNNSFPLKKSGEKIPVGIKFHGLNMFQKPPSFRGWMEQWMFRPAVKFNLRQSDYVFSYGGKITDITRTTGIESSKIIEIPTGIDHDWLMEKSNRRVGDTTRFLYAGRYERLKGIEEISKSVKNLNSGKYAGSFEFHFVGPIPQHRKIKAANVFYHGSITDSKLLKEQFSQCDFLVCPSYSEGMPNVILEAMARGLAIIATDVGAVNCMVNHDNGFLLEQCTVKNIEDAMIEALTVSEEKLSVLKNNSLKKIRENFLWETIARKLIAEIEKITK